MLGLQKAIERQPVKGLSLFFVQSANGLPDVGQRSAVLVVKQGCDIGVPEDADRLWHFGIFADAPPFIVEIIGVEMQVFGHGDIKRPVGFWHPQNEAALVFVDFDVFDGTAEIGNVFDQAVQGGDIAHGQGLREEG